MSREMSFAMLLARAARRCLVSLQHGCTCVMLPATRPQRRTQPQRPSIDEAACCCLAALQYAADCMMGALRSPKGRMLACCSSRLTAAASPTSADSHPHCWHSACQTMHSHTRQPFAALMPCSTCSAGLQRCHLVLPRETDSRLVAVVLLALPAACRCTLQACHMMPPQDSHFSSLQHVPSRPYSALKPPQHQQSINQSRLLWPCSLQKPSMTGSRAALHKAVRQADLPPPILGFATPPSAARAAAAEALRLAATAARPVAAGGAEFGAAGLGPRLARWPLIASLQHRQAAWGAALGVGSDNRGFVRLWLSALIHATRLIMMQQQCIPLLPTMRSWGACESGLIGRGWPLPTRVGPVRVDVSPQGFELLILAHADETLLQQADGTLRHITAQISSQQQATTACFELKCLTSCPRSKMARTTSSCVFEQAHLIFARKTITVQYQTAAASHLIWCTPHADATLAA